MGTTRIDAETVRYLSAERADKDDFGRDIPKAVGSLVFDAPTSYGPWAMMTYESWMHHRKTDKLGVGLGQKYRRDAKGRFVLVEGL